MIRHCASDPCCNWFTPRQNTQQCCLERCRKRRADRRQCAADQSPAMVRHCASDPCCNWFTSRKVNQKQCSTTCTGRKSARIICARHPERERERKRKWLEANLEKERDRNRKRRAANPETHRGYCRKYYAGNVEKCRKHYAGNVEKFNARSRRRGRNKRALKQLQQLATLKETIDVNYPVINHPAAE